MKKIMYWMLATILICGASVFTSCVNDDNPAVEPDLNLAEKTIGKWIIADVDGQPALTNEKVVYEFVSATKAYVSLSFTDNAGDGTPWTDRAEATVDIVGNDVTMTHSPERIEEIKAQKKSWWKDVNIYYQTLVNSANQPTERGILSDAWIGVENA